jgi:beta-N-acetylhexosaminidase
MLVVGFDGLYAPDYILEWLARGQVGGIIFFARNVDTPEQLANLTQSLHRAAKYPLLVAIDQEGGAVSRLRQGFTESPGAMALAAAGDEALAEEVAMMIGRELRAVGINWNLAPVVDMLHNINNPSVGTRSLGSDPVQVGELAAAQIRGFQKAGVAACAKHFPGLGNTPIDTHDELAVIGDSLDTLRQGDLIPFRAVAEVGVSSIMITHVNFPALDARYPSTMSYEIITGLLRQEVGFEGLICTDCMEMNAITKHYPASESGVRAAQGGADMILYSHTRPRQTEAYEAILAAAQSGEISLERIDSAAARVMMFKQRFVFKDQLDPRLIRHPSHLEISQRAARASIVLVKSLPDMLPLRAGSIGLIEFSPNVDSIAMDSTGLSDLTSHMQQRFPGLQSVILDPQAPQEEAFNQALQLAKHCQTLLIATRNAHLLPEQQAAAQAILDAHPAPILLCLRNPFDAQVLRNARGILCTCGDSTPSLEALADALAGRFAPTGRLPVEISL